MYFSSIHMFHILYKFYIIFDVIASRCSIIKMLDNFTVVSICFNDGP